MKETFPIGQGHGTPNRFAGLPDPYGEESFAEIAILSAPFDETTTYQHGCDKGPAAIIEASRHLELYDIETETEVYLKGIYTAPAVKARKSLEMLEDLYAQTKKYLKQKKCVVTLGGEHSISYAPIKAHSEDFPGCTVLQFDAHADLQPAYEGDPWSHASVMKRVQELPGIKKIVSVGIRSLSKEELPFLDRPSTFFAHELDLNNLWIDKVLAQLSDPVYITFDLDVFDSALMPSTGTPEPGGLFWNQALSLLKRVSEKHRIIGFDVVELLPRPQNHAPDFLAAKLIYKLLSYIYKVKRL